MNSKSVDENPPPPSHDIAPFPKAIRLAFVDFDGQIRGKWMHPKKFEGAFTEGFGFCDVVFGWDSDDRLYSNSSLCSSERGYPDAAMHIDPSSFRQLSFGAGNISAFVEVDRTQEGLPHPACSRSLLSHQQTQLQALGFDVQCGFDLEFFLESTAETPIIEGKMGGYSWAPMAQYQPYLAELWQACHQAGIKLEGLHPETGHGAFEVAFEKCSALELADSITLFRYLAYEIGLNYQIHPVFLAKPSQTLPGCSGHVHLSVWQSGENLFTQVSGAEHPNEILQRLLSLLVDELPAATIFSAPNINSYKRYVPNVWAPNFANWGDDNRNCTIRRIRPDSSKLARLEYRLPGADIHPYICLSYLLDAIFRTIEAEKAQASYTIVPASNGAAALSGLSLPRHLGAAIESCRANKERFNGLGKDFVDNYLATRQNEFE